MVDELPMSLDPFGDGSLHVNIELTQFVWMGFCCGLIAVSSLINGILVEDTGVR